MQSLVRSMRSRADDGKVVPTVFRGLEKIGAKPRFGQVMMVAAAPGGAKSALITHYVRELGLPTLYISADTDRTTMTLRIIAGVTGYPLATVETGLQSAQRDWWLSQADAATKHIGFTWDASPSFDDIDDEVLAYAAVHGQYPSIIVMDNLKDLGATTPGEGGEHVNYDRGIQFLHELSRQTGALVIVLHHTLGEYEDGYKPVPLSGLKGKVGKTPRLILSLYRKRPGVMGVCVIKNTAGPADPTCKLQTEFFFSPETMSFAEAS